MVTKISEGVKISVEVFYQQDYSNPLQSEYMFAYRVTIENFNPFDIKLLTRHWFIFDSDGSRREVEGEGVVGLQPIIAKRTEYDNNEYQYVSGCNLHTEIGQMRGTYTMQNMITKELFNVRVPEFDMVVPFKYN